MNISEPEFTERLIAVLEPIRGKVKSTCGPGRSGAMAAVYASHRLNIPWVEASMMNRPGFPKELMPVLIIDAARDSGATLRKLAAKADRNGIDFIDVWLFDEPPRRHFWYEPEVFNAV